MPKRASVFSLALASSPSLEESYEMVQNYGTAGQRAASPETGDNESSSLLGPTSDSPRREGQAGMLSSVSNL
jgi:hypothetical protein